jgi:CRP/FNR family transcriptional regulator, cyclic AMP receptor protein
VNLLGLFRNAKDVNAYAAGEVIFTEGQPRDVMYVILEGEVDIQKHGQSLYKAGPGEILGEMALIDSKGRSASAVALSHCRLASLNERQFLFMVQETPGFALHVMQVLVERIRLLNARAHEPHTASLEPS